ncbi:transposase [Streptomyces sp. G2]|uniref:transposase n=1 Tax=Streptomyces TaxID=1883 RepID=UPI003F91542F
MLCRFLARLVNHFDRKVHLIVDRHSAHRSKAVRTSLADHEDQIELYFLPSHSPEPNSTTSSTPISNTACPTPTGPGARPNSPPKPAGSSACAMCHPTGFRRLVHISTQHRPRIRQRET